MSNWEQALSKCLDQKVSLVVIGTSAGGVEAMQKIIKSFRRPSSVSMALVMHMSSEGQNLIPELIKDLTDFTVKEAEPGENIQPATIYVAPTDYHLSIEADDTLSLSTEERVNFSRPSIDLLFESAGHAKGPATLGILLTGANHDGAQGLSTLQRHGGVVVIQQPKSAKFSEMPKAGIDKTSPDFVASIEEISDFLDTFIRRRR